MKSIPFKLIVLSIFIFHFVLTVTAGNPSGNENNLIIGESCIQLKNKSEDIVTAKNGALRDLASQIQCNVKSEFLHIVTEISNSISEYTKSRVNVISNLKLEGVRFEVNETSNLISVKAILNKNDARRIYFEKTKNLESLLFSSFKRINKLISIKENNEALKELYKASCLFDRIEQNIIIYISLGGERRNDLVNKISREELDERIFNLLKHDIKSIEDAARSLSYTLSKNLINQEKIFISPFYYKNTQFGSQFSTYFQQKMNGVFLMFPHISILEETANKEYSCSKVYGNYWVNGDAIEIITTLYDSLGIATGSARVSFLKKIISDQGIKFEPQNIIMARKEDPLFSKQNSIYGNLNFSFWTNRGHENPHFKQGDSVKFFIQVGEPCYISIIYHLANGIRTPLYENYFIGMSQVNQPIQLPYEAVCYPPFGVEKIQAFATTEKMPALNLVQTNIDGIIYKVLAEDLDTFISRTRGMIVNQSKFKKRAERVITVTTTEKF